MVATVLTISLGLAHSGSPDGLAMTFGYQAADPFASYPGGSAILEVSVQNTGSVPERIVEMTITVDLAKPVSSPAQIPLVLAPGERKGFDVQVQIPSTASLGWHGAEASVSFQYLDAATQQWLPSRYSPITMNSGLPVYKSPGQTFQDGFAILGGTTIVAATIPVIAWKRKVSSSQVGRGLGLVAGTFGLLVTVLTVVLSENPDLSTRILSATLFANSFIGIAGCSRRMNGIVTGLAMIGGALLILPAWGYGFWVQGLTSQDAGAQTFLASTILFFWWISLLFVGGLMITFSKYQDARRLIEMTQKNS
jgi:hypothetical protein